MTDTPVSQVVEAAWYLTRNGKTIEDSLTFTPPIEREQRHGGHAEGGKGSYLATRVTIALSMYDYRATYPDGGPYLGSIDGMRAHRVYRDQEGRLFVLRQRQRFHLEEQVAAAVEKFIAADGVKDDSPTTGTPRHHVLDRLENLSPGLLDQLFPTDEPVLFLPETEYGENWSDFILYDGGSDAGVIFSISPDREVKYRHLRGD